MRLPDFYKIDSGQCGRGSDFHRLVPVLEFVALHLPIDGRIRTSMNIHEYQGKELLRKYGRFDSARRSVLLGRGSAERGREARRQGVGSGSSVRSGFSLRPGAAYRATVIRKVGLAWYHVPVP